MSYSFTQANDLVTINDGLDNLKSWVNAVRLATLPGAMLAEMFINADSASWIERRHAQHPLIQRDAAMRDQLRSTPSIMAKDEPLNVNCFHPHTQSIAVVYIVLPAKMNRHYIGPPPVRGGVCHQTKFVAFQAFGIANVGVVDRPSAITPHNK